MYNEFNTSGSRVNKIRLFLLIYEINEIILAHGSPEGEALLDS